MFAALLFYLCSVKRINLVAEVRNSYKLNILKCRILIIFTNIF